MFTSREYVADYTQGHTLLAQTHTQNGRQKRTTGTQIIIARAPLSIADSVRQNQWSCSPLARMRLSCLSLSLSLNTSHTTLSHPYAPCCVFRLPSPLKCQKTPLRLPSCSVCLSLHYPILLLLMGPPSKMLPPSSRVCWL